MAKQDTGKAPVTRDELDETVAPKSRPKGLTFAKAVTATRKALRAEAKAADAPKGKPKAAKRPAEDKPERKAFGAAKADRDVRVRLVLSTRLSEAQVREALDAVLERLTVADEVSSYRVTRVREAGAEVAE